MLMSYKSNHEQLTKRGIPVTCANGGQLVSTATDVINFHGIPTAAKKCHKFPNHQLINPLLSLGKLTEHGCNVNFRKYTVEVTNSDGLTILVGQKYIGRNIYTVPLPLGKSQHAPKDIPSFITPKDNPSFITQIPASATTVEHGVPGQPDYAKPRLGKLESGNPRPRVIHRVIPNIRDVTHHDPRQMQPIHDLDATQNGLKHKKCHNSLNMAQIKLKLAKTDSPVFTKRQERNLQLLPP